MPRIRCRYIDCMYLDDGLCGATAVIITPDEGCMTYAPLDDPITDTDWEDEALNDYWDEEDEEFIPDEEDEELWYDDEL